MHFADEAGRAAACRADPACGLGSAGTVADLAGTDAEVVFIVRHETTIGSRNAPGKGEYTVVVE
jgi:hypothetical protein